LACAAISKHRAAAARPRAGIHTSPEHAPRAATECSIGRDTPRRTGYDGDTRATFGLDTSRPLSIPRRDGISPHYQTKWSDCDMRTHDRADVRRDVVPFVLLM
jgi:hypothetical protein